MAHFSPFTLSISRRASWVGILRLGNTKGHWNRKQPIAEAGNTEGGQQTADSMMENKRDLTGAAIFDGQRSLSGLPVAAGSKWPGRPLSLRSDSHWHSEIRAVNSVRATLCLLCLSFELSKTLSQSVTNISLWRHLDCFQVLAFIDKTTYSLHML